MDNYIDYIIILFFVVSFLASIFKKKKEPEQKTGGVKREQQDYDLEYAKTRQSPSEEVFVLESPRVDEFKTPSRLLKEQQMEGVINKSKKEFVQPVRLVDRKKVDTKIKRKQIDHGKKDLTMTLKSKLRNPKSVREFLVISEILNKPLALRK
ncbi:MAG: hypothetical protein KJ799_15065 [Bacteroidetes bacterium]|nr:hypothetical protein [Bacteroidota bacterium]